MPRTVLSRLSPYRLLALWGVSWAVATGLAAAQEKPAAPPTTAKPEQSSSKVVDPLDWPHWRGPEMNGISREKGLVDTWSTDGENLLWRQEELAARCTPIVMNGRIYTVARAFPETTQEGEQVVCADAATGEILWKNTRNIFLSDAPAERVGWASPVGDPTTGNIYWLGLGCEFSCINGETGETLWSQSLSETYGMLSTYGGRTNIPTIFDDLVIVSGVMTGWGEYSVPAHRFLALNKLTGEPVWLQSTNLRPPDTTFSTPVLTVFKGEAALVVGTSEGAVYAFQPRTGKVIWKYSASIRGLNQTPLVAGTTVFCGHSEEDFDNPAQTGSFFAINGEGQGDITKTNRIWNVPEVASGRSAPLLWDDRLYVVTDNANMFILNPKNGKQIGRQKLGTIMTGSLLYADGKIYAAEQTGRWYIMEPSEKGVKILSKDRIDGEELIASPIASHGRVYFTSNGAMYCLGTKDQTPEADPQPERAVEAPADEDQTPAQVQVVPVEALIKPGEKIEYQVRLYNARGQFLKAVKADGITLKGPGAVDADGVYTAPTKAAPAAVMVTAKVGELTGTARLRVIPPLPWSFDFADKEIPLTWIGARGRHVFREVEGEPMMVKITTIPLGTRSQCWFGPTDLHDYTIQADVQGDLKNAKMPDIGLINQRYTLDLMGGQQLQLRSWTPRLELRFAKTIPFTWKPKEWYVMKFQSENQDDRVILRGKVWPRGTKEPAEWSIEAADMTPNRIGSPGLFGRSQDAEIFIDNVKVFANDAPSATAEKTKAKPAEKKE